VVLLLHIQEQQKNITEQLGQQVLDLNTARTGVAGAGTQTAGLAFGGYIGPPTTAATEEYDGSTWTSNPTGLNTARQEMGAAGTQTAALAFGGDTSPATAATEEWTGGGPVTKTVTVS
jgi:hypothetical protein